MEKNTRKDDHIRQGIKRASEEGVLLYKTNRPDKPATLEQIIGVSGVKEGFYYALEFIVKDEDGNLKEMWFSDDAKDKGKDKRKKGRGR